MTTKTISFRDAVMFSDYALKDGRHYEAECAFHIPTPGDKPVILRCGTHGEAIIEASCCRAELIVGELLKRQRAGYKPTLHPEYKAMRMGFQIPPVFTENGANPDPSVASVASIPVADDFSTPPRDLEPEALYGLPGDLVRTIGPHTEAHPAAILASFLVGAGCILGRQAYIYRDGARHAGNEFACLVGLSGVSRKGTATRRVNEVLYSDNSNYTKLTTCHGLGSGEALVASLCEDAGEGKFADHRRLVLEEEFSRALKVMRREGSTLSENLRSAWDSGILASRTKGKRMEVKDAHVAVLGHITEAEMRLELGQASLWNGFANRFLWICTRRVRSLPFGGGDAPIAPIVSTFHKTLEWAASQGRMEFDDQAKAMWDKGGLYDLLIDRPAGLFGAVTSRAEAHVTRLSLLYALLDASREIRADHLMAALAVWDYSERSAGYLFGKSLGNDYADEIGAWLQEVHPGFVTRKEIRDFFSHHARTSDIEAGLRLLEKQGCAIRGKVATPGRHAETWVWNVVCDGDGSDICDRRVLQRARKLL